MIGYLVALAVGAAAGWMARQMIAPPTAPATPSPATPSLGDADRVRQECARAMAELEKEFEQRLEAIAQLKKGA